MKEFAEKIKQYRGKHRLTQDQFAELCGIGRVTLIRIERGLQNPTALTEYKINEILKKDE